MSLPTEFNCSEQYNWLVIVTCVLSVLVTIVSVPINLVVFLAIIKNKKFYTIFYYIILSTTTSDLLIAAILCPLSISIHASEIQKQPMSDTIQRIFQCALSTLCMVSVLCITILSIDRMISLKFPARYRAMKNRNFVISLVVVWLLAIGLSPIYFLMEFKLYLLMTSVVIVIIASVMLLVTYRFYRAQLNRTYSRTHSNREEENCDGSISSKRGSMASLPMSLKRKFTRTKKDSTTSFTSLNQTKLDEDYQIYQIEKRATNTFFCVMLSFLLCYIPIVGVSVAIATQIGQQNCLLLSLLHECTILFSLLSSVCKTTVFLTRLTSLRKSCTSLFITRKNIERKWQQESVPVIMHKKKKSLKEQLLHRKPDDIQEEVDV